MKNKTTVFHRRSLFISLIFAALLFVSCDPVVDTSTGDIYGTWSNSSGEKYVITSSYYNNYYGFTTLYYSTDNVVVVKSDDYSGYVYCQFNDASHLGYGATVGQWYALHYKELTSSSVKISQAYKSGGKAACDSLEQAREEYTIANGYFGSYSELEEK